MMNYNIETIENGSVALEELKNNLGKCILLETSAPFTDSIWKDNLQYIDNGKHMHILVYNESQITDDEIAFIEELKTMCETVIVYMYADDLYNDNIESFRKLENISDTWVIGSRIVKSNTKSLFGKSIKFNS